MKKELCLKNNINLIIIPCFEWNKIKTRHEKKKYLLNLIDDYV
jgi:hypothetical protein